MASGENGFDWLARHWRLAVLVGWIIAAVTFLVQRWSAIRWFALGDTDDNMRIMQVRALLAGQGWFDLRQYRLDPPFGSDIHWSRLVDLPIAGMILGLRPLVGGQLAEKVAVAIAPMLPMAVAMVALALVARRLIAPKAFALAVILLFFAPSTLGMFVPLRIDHHGWQLAMLALTMAGFVDPKPARGGLVVGLASAVSLVIGLEMLIYLAVAGAIVVLMWVRDPGEVRRISAYGASLGGGSALGFLLFASYANRAPVCDALSPVWLSVMVAAGALCLLLALIAPSSVARRFAAAAVGGVLVAAMFALLWPHCLGRLEGVSPEAQRLWLDGVREAKPIYSHSLRTIFVVTALPLAGLIGYAILIWRARGDIVRLRGWLALGTLTLISTCLLFWQTRAGPAAQLLAVPGAAGIGWLMIIRLRQSQHMLVRVFGIVTAFLLVSGVAIQLATNLLPADEPDTPRSKAIGRANSSCPTLPAMRPVALQPKGYVLTFVDLAPRLITVTHHDAVTGPYHRNDDAIVDVMRAFRGSADEARRMIERRHIDYVLICPNMSESTVYQVQTPKGFYAQLAKGTAPDWLEPIKLPARSPLRMWRVRR